MLTAAFLICNALNSNDCMLFIDTRGPYFDEIGCEARLAEMSEWLVKEFPYEQYKHSTRCGDHPNGVKL